MNVYDQAHALASAIRQSEEYKLFAQTKEAAFESDANKQLLEEYKRLQFQLQVAMAGGGSPDADELERFQKIASLLQYSPEASAYMLAEIQLQRMIADVFKIVSDAADINIGMLDK